VPKYQSAAQLNLRLIFHGLIHVDDGDETHPNPNPAAGPSPAYQSRPPPHRNTSLPSPLRTTSARDPSLPYFTLLGACESRKHFKYM
jgi:hypothetical protein